MQAKELAADVASSGLSDAQGGLKLLRVPWLIVEGPEGQDLKCNRDGEPMEAGDSNRWGLILFYYYYYYIYIYIFIFIIKCIFYIY